MKLKKFLLLLCCLLTLESTALAKPHYGAVQAADFSYQGLALGDTVEKMHQVLGEELFDTDKNVFDVHVKFYTYKKLVVGVDTDTGLVADIVIKDEDFRLRDDVRRGATVYKIFSTYGEAARQFVAGITGYVYSNPARPQERLLLEIEAGGTNALETARLTALPLTDEEAAQRKPSQEWQGNGLNDFAVRDHDIDMSALQEKEKQGTDGQKPHDRAKITYHYEVNKGV